MKFDKDGNLILPKKFTKVIKHSEENYDEIYKDTKSGNNKR